MRLKVKPKRIVSLALAGCMAVSMVPASAVTAFAAENTNVPAISTGTEGEEENQSKSVTVEVTEAGKLEEAVKAEAEKQGIALSDITELTVKGGPLNAADFQFMSGVVVSETADKRFSSVYTPDAVSCLKNLKVLDLSKATCENNAIPPRAFQRNSVVEKIILPENLERTYIHAFSMMSALTYLGTTEGNLKFPETMKIMGEGMVYHDENLVGTLTFPASLEAIGSACFEDTGIYGEVIIPAGVNITTNTDAKYTDDNTSDYKPTENVFNKSKISSLTFENGVEEISTAFAKNCENLTNVVLPSTVKKIDAEAFRGTKLSSLPNLENVKEIGYSAFRELKSEIDGNLTFPSGTVYGDSAFRGLKLNGNLTIESANCGSYFLMESDIKGNVVLNCPTVPNSFLYRTDKAYDGKSLIGGKLELGTGVETIPSAAFNGAGLTGTLTIPDGVTTIGESAFRHNQFSGTIVIPESVESIGVAAFSYVGGGANNDATTEAQSTERKVDGIIVENPDVKLGKFAFANQKDGVKIYFASASVPENSDSYWSADTTILLATAGGTIDTTKGFDSDTGLYTPEKSDGSRFDGWYEDVTKENTKVTKKNPAVAGKKYVAKWTSNPSELTTDIGEKTFVVGEPVEFSFTTAANGDEGTPVIGTSNFSDADAIEKLEYYEQKDSNWYELKGDYGVAAGFPMTDATSKFRVTFKKPGDYTFTASMKKAGTDTVLCSTKVNFTVGTMQAAATVTDEDGTSMTSYKANEPVRVTLKAAPNDPEAFKKNTLSLTYGDEVEKVELNGQTLDKTEYPISDLLDMMDTADAQIAVQAVNAGETITIPLDVTYKTNGEHPFKMEVRNNAGTTVCEKEVTVKISDEEPMPVGSHTLTVKGGTVKVNGAKVDLEKNLTTVPEDATVEVTFDQDAFADSNLKFSYWNITGLSDEEAAKYNKQESFTFKMPANNVTLEAMTQDATIEDGPDILGTAAVITTAAVGGAVLAWQGYQIGTELYLTYLLPAGAAIPANTAELAKLVWTDAGKPAPAAVLPEDATEEQQAMAWAVESGLISADKAPDASVSKTDVIKTWKKAQERKG